LLARWLTVSVLADDIFLPFFKLFFAFFAMAFLLLSLNLSLTNEALPSESD
jgi:hypothetical protein